MAKVTLTASCCVSETSYNKAREACLTLQTSDPDALVALLRACNKASLVDRKYVGRLHKHSVVDRTGGISEEIIAIVKIALRHDGSKLSWAHEINGRRVSK